MTKMEIVQEFPKVDRARGGHPLCAETAFVIAALAAGQFARLECESPKKASMRRTATSATLTRRRIPYQTRIVDNTVYFAPRIPEDQR